MSLQSTWSCVRPAAARRVPTTASRATAAAAFSTTSSRGNIPPESPSYIRLPHVRQSTEVKPQRVRGTLPVPRDVFQRTDGDRKVRAEYIEKTAPRRTRERSLETDTQKWKKQIADSRRQNLEEGLQGLWQRYNVREEKRATRARRQQLEVDMARQAPERRVDRMTRGTILESINDTEVRPDPERFEKSERSRQKTLARQEARRDARRDALMELYSNATGFIVTEAELKEEVERIFSPDYFVKQSMKVHRPGATENAWGVHGKPPGTATMLEPLTQRSTNIARSDMSEFDHSSARTKRISEEFTGGKLE